MKRRAFAVVAHPDDIEFMMAGTLLRLRKEGFEIHYMNLADGCCGAREMGREETILVRRRESEMAASRMGAIFHQSLFHDLEIMYDSLSLAKVGAVMREVAPSILLVPSLSDYMEDHVNTARLMVAAAFARGMPNFRTSPRCEPVPGCCAVYHALPYGLKDALGNELTAKIYVNIESEIGRKRDLLACHDSQKRWLDQSQGLDSYLDSMTAMCEAMGKQSGKYRYAEGWTLHNPLGFSSASFDPLAELFDSQRACRECSV